MSLLLTYLGLFSAAFLSATLLPGHSELVLAGLISGTEISPWSLVAVATVGNVAGSVVNWLMGFWATRFEGKRWFPVKRATLQKAEGWYHRYGRWSLLLSWVPVIGDPLTVVAGFLREPFPVFLTLVTIAKTARYVILALIVQGLL